MTHRPPAYLVFPAPADALAQIEAACAVERWSGPGMPTVDDLCRSLGESEGLFISTVNHVTEDVMAAAPRLRVISSFGVGFDHVDISAATRRRILVCNTPGVLTDAVADLTMCLIIMLARRIPEAQAFVREGRWLPGQGFGLGADVRGKTLGIIGFGRIGRAVADRARPFGMRVMFHDLIEEPGEGYRDCDCLPLDDVLREADFVSLHVNLTSTTTHHIGARELSLMKPTAYLINTARGPVVDQEALAKALEVGAIAGAALDVMEREPPDPDDPILSLPNALVLPHIGSATKETRRAMLDLAVENLLAGLRGDVPPAAVNPEVLTTRKSLA
jgi:glyoxylate reductase